jgi:subtilisin-like proprotein convertase family protein/uncharacterized protein YegL
MTLRTRSLITFFALCVLGLAETAGAQSWFRQRTYERRTAPVQPTSNGERQALDALARRYASKVVPVAETVTATGLPLTIPDDGPAVTSKITIPDGDAVTGLSVSVAISHQARGDLRVRLIAPGGQSYTLADETGGTEDNLVISTRAITIPAEGTIHGTWTLSVQDRDDRNIGSLTGWSMQVSRIESAVIDLTMSLESTPDEDVRLVYERIVGHFADAVYEMTNGAHRIGRVRVFTGGRNFGSADVRWGLKGTPHVPRNGGVGVVGGHIMMYETFTGTKLQPGDTSSTYWSMNLLKDEMGAGYTMAHEWGHYFLGLYDESTPHTCGAKEEVKPSIMANQWKATEGKDRFDWLNLSIARDRGGDFEIAKSTCQFFAHGTGAWPVLSRSAEDDPTDGTSMKFQTLGPRLFYPELALVAPVDGTRRRLDLPSNRARVSLEVVWMASHTALEIVLDRSGSMAGPKLAKAKAAAKLLVDQAVIGETSVGITVFDHTVTNLLDVTDLDNEDVREKLKAIIDDIVTAGTTAIGDAATVALEKLRSRKDDAETRVVFLLTDGQNNAGRAPEEVIDAFTESRIPLFTFGFGNDVDEKSLSLLAEATGGRYYTSPTTLAALTEAFREATQVAVSSAGAGAGELSPTPSRPDTRVLAVDASMSRLQISVVVPVGAQASQVQVVSPTGPVAPSSVQTVPGAETLVWFDVAAPAVGTWQLVTSTTTGAPTFAFGVTAVQNAVGFAVNTGVRGGGFTVSTPGPVIIESRLTRRQAIAGAEVVARVTMPGGASVPLVMNDRGAFPDVTAGDGHYAGVFEPAGAGVYAVAVEFSNHAGQAYETYTGAMLTPGAADVPEDARIDEAFVRSETVHVTVTAEASISAPRVLLSPASVETAAGQSATFVVGAVASPIPTYQWQRLAVGTSTWLDVTDGVVGGVRISGAGTDTLRLDGVAVRWFGDQFRARVTNSVGGVVSDVARLQQAGGSVAVDRQQLVFVIDGTTRAATPAQVVTVLTAGVPAPAWTMATSAPWVVSSVAGGVGNGVVTVSVDADRISSSTRATMTVAPVAPGAVAQVIDVLVTVTESATGRAPFGQVDTPAQGTTGAQGAIGLTGWVLDDVGVQRIGVFRQCLPFDAPASCQDVLGASLVWLGDAVSLPGARPDVEAAYPGYPASQTAGWGFLVLSNLLPHITRGTAEGGGQGTFEFHIIATDVEGQRVRLGRTTDDHTPTTVQVDNDTLAKPFGTIDTPRVGETVSGQVANFGWALTPDANTTTGGDDVLVPVNGQTITVFVDGVPTGQVAFNQCRGSFTGALTAGDYCDDDIASIFGHVRPEATFSARVANTTRFRNLDAGRGAIGSFVLDTTTLSNGLHTLAWSVTDSLGRTEGIGSRFFTVLNPSVPADVAMTRAPLGAALRSAGPIVLEGRTGFDLGAAWMPVLVEADGQARVRITEQGRLELRASVEISRVVHVDTNGATREWPIGAAVTGTTFTWMPPVGYVGVYHFIVEAGGAAVTVAVRVAPTERAPEGTSEVRMHLDGAVAAGGRVVLDGWAYDPQAAIGSGIGAVHVWARSLNPAAGESTEPFFLGAAEVGRVRADVAQQYPDASSSTGYRLEAALSAGTWELTAYVWNVRTRQFEDARRVVIIAR